MGTSSPNAHVRRGWHWNPASKELQAYDNNGMEIIQYPHGPRYYVESNAGDNDLSGGSWGTAKKTLAAAITLANTYVAAASTGWASRPTIYYKGDNNTEVLTALPNKTDIIGVGSSDGLKHPVLVGAQVPTTGTGTRFINMGFREEAGVCITIPTTVSSVTFLDCKFLGGTSSTTALLATASTDLTVEGCWFIGDWTGGGKGWSTAAISLATGSAQRTLIRDNIIDNGHASGGSDGIIVNSGRTGPGSYIIGNFINAKTICIDDESDTFYVYSNRGASLANEGDTCVDINESFAADNLFNSANNYTAYPIFPKDNFTTTT